MVNRSMPFYRPNHGANENHKWRLVSNIAHFRFGLGSRLFAAVVGLRNSKNFLLETIISFRLS